MTLSCSRGSPTAPKKIAVERPQAIERIGRHHSPVGDVMFRAPVEVLPLEPNGAFGDGVEHANRGRDDLAADAVARNDRDAIGAHEVVGRWSLVVVSR